MGLIQPYLKKLAVNQKKQWLIRFFCSFCFLIIKNECFSIAFVHSKNNNKFIKTKTFYKLPFKESNFLGVIPVTKKVCDIGSSYMNF